jgi:hypothetical protein
MKYPNVMPPVPPNPSLQATPVPGAPELERSAAHRSPMFLSFTQSLVYKEKGDGYH